MAGQKGSELLVKVGNGGSPESFTTVGGLRDTSISINQEMLDITNKDSFKDNMMNTWNITNKYGSKPNQTMFSKNIDPFPRRDMYKVKHISFDSGSYNMFVTFERNCSMVSNICLKSKIHSILCQKSQYFQKCSGNAINSNLPFLSGEIELKL